MAGTRLPTPWARAFSRYSGAQDQAEVKKVPGRRLSFGLGSFKSWEVSGIVLPLFVSTVSH
jgi:hypothetical protein